MHQLIGVMSCKQRKCFLHNVPTVVVGDCSLYAA